MQWLSYTPDDLVPFSHQTWLALVGRYNEGHVAAVIGGMALGLLVLWLAAGRSTRRLRLALALLGVCWFWISWAFLHQALGALLWAADWLAWGFAAQGALLLLSAAMPMTEDDNDTARLPSLSGSVDVPAAWWLLAAAVLLWPALDVSARGDWVTAGWFGTTPDATAVGTLAVAAMTPGRRAWLLLPVPLLWCLIAASMLSVFAARLWWLPLGAAVLTGPLLWLGRRRTAGPTKVPRRG